ncbi:hypothetical protein WDU94_005625, partial [Cyamophila willieti]
LVIERLDEEIQTRSECEQNYGKILAEYNKLKAENKTIKENCSIQKKINSSLAEDAEITEQASNKINDENTQIIKSLHTKLETKMQENQKLQTEKEKLRKTNKELTEENTKKLNNKEVEIRQLQENINTLKQTNNELKEQNLSMMTLLDKNLNEEEAARTKLLKEKVPEKSQSRGNQSIQLIQTAASTSNAEQQQMNAQQTSATPDIEIREKVSITKLFVIGDSHTRDVQPIIQNAIQSKFSVKTICMPGKTLGYVINTIKPEKLASNVQVCIVAGANDVFRTSWKDIQDSIDKLYRKCKNNNILFVLAPPRYDIRKINKHITNMNVKIKHYIKKYSNMTCIDPHNFITLQHMGQDLAHLTRRGKIVLCNKIVGRVFGLSVKSDTVIHKTNKSSSHNHQAVHRTFNRYTYKRQSQVNRNSGLRNAGNSDEHQYHNMYDRRNSNMRNVQGYNKVPPRQYFHPNANEFPPLPSQRNILDMKYATHYQPYRPLYSDTLAHPGFENPYDYPVNPYIRTQNRYDTLQQNFRRT